jgi:hypothetical protein
MYSLGFVDEILRPDRNDNVQFIPACMKKSYGRYFIAMLNDLHCSLMDH